MKREFWRPMRRHRFLNRRLYAVVGTILIFWVAATLIDVRPLLERSLICWLSTVHDGTMGGKPTKLIEIVWWKWILPARMAMAPAEVITVRSRVRVSD